MTQKTMATHVRHTGDQLYRFTTDFFRAFGATVRKADRRKHGNLHVSLPETLATYFEQEKMTLTFQHAEGDAELVAFGSRVFDRMIAFLDRRSAVTIQQLPARHAAGEELLRAVQPVNTSITGLKTNETIRYLCAFNWHVTYRADDKREELYTVLLDEDGQRLAHMGADVRQSGAYDLDTLYADAQPIPVETDADGQPLPPKLPPMTHLARLAETARKFAIYHADLRCAAHEADILPRLHKTLSRLTSYYGQQMEELYEPHDPTGAKRRALEQDLERKVAEEVENHRLRVQVRLFSYALFYMPVAVADLTLADGRRETTVRVVRNRYDGQLTRPTCHACSQETTILAVDRNGHVTCDDCLEQCAGCREILCARCGVMPCPVCGDSFCAECGSQCWACGERACAAHIDPCPVCGDPVCHQCQTGCAACGVRQCRSHLRADAVLSTAENAALICRRCAVQCAGCGQYSAQVGTCHASGQRFCTNCLVTCDSCGEQVGAGFYRTDPADGRILCTRCHPEPALP